VRVWGMRKDVVVAVSAADRARLEAIVADRNSPQKHVWRARIVLLTAAELGTVEIMRRTGKSKTRVRRWQERTEPFFQWAFDGCHVTRDIPSLIREGGFKIEEMDTAYLAPFPKSPSHCFWGVARPESR